MAETMKVLAFLGVGKAGVIEKPIPEPVPRDAVVKATSSMVCTSDVHAVRGVIEIPEERGLGHESVGIVHRVGQDGYPMLTPKGSSPPRGAGSLCPR